MRESDLLKKARGIREKEHRLRPSLRLRTLEDVVDFVHSKGLVSMLGGNELPSVVSALMGRHWRPGGKGFKSWLDWWNIRISERNAGRLLADIPRREDVIGTRIFRNSKTFVSEKLWPILDPITGHYRDLAGEHKILSQAEWRILQTLEERGPVRTDKLRITLGLKGKQHTSRFHRSLIHLENHGLILGYEDPKPEKHLHASVWHLWSQRVRTVKEPISYEEAMAKLLEKTIDSCVFAAEEDLSKWFCWNGELAKAKDDLVANGRILRAGPYLFTSRIAD